jgi:hypothetical protein
LPYKQGGLIHQFGVVTLKLDYFCYCYCIELVKIRSWYPPHKDIFALHGLIGAHKVTINLTLAEVHESGTKCLQTF